MKDRLEEFMSQNREAFDVHEPDPSLWLRINPEKDTIKLRKPLAWLRYAVAAAIIFACLSAGIFYISGVSSQPEKIYGELYNEILETEAFYTSIVNQKYSELQAYFSSAPNLKKELDYDLNELDNIYLELKEDLKDNIGNPEVVEAMIQQYRTKVEILEDLLNQLKEKENNDYEEEKKFSL
jgi:hypothetical protein